MIGEFALAYAPTGAVWFLSSVREQPALIRLLAPLPPRSPRVTGLFIPVFIFSEALTLVSSIVAAAVTYLLFRGPIGHPGLFAPAMVSLSGYLLFTNPAWNIDGVLFSLSGGPGPVLDPISSDGRLPGLCRGGELLHADGVGPDPFHRRLMGDLAGSSPLCVTEVDALVGTRRRDPQQIPRAAAHPAIRTQGDTRLPRHRSKRPDRDVDPGRLRFDQCRGCVEPSLGAESSDSSSSTTGSPRWCSRRSSSDTWVKTRLVSIAPCSTHSGISPRECCYPPPPVAERRLG